MAIRWDQFYNIVNGQPRDSSVKHHGFNPSTGQRLWSVPVGSQQDIDEAVSAGQKAFKSWSLLDFEERKDYVRKFRDHYLKHIGPMVQLLCEESGKPQWIAEFEVMGVRKWFDHHLSLSLPEERLEDDEKVVVTRYTPLGVVGAICPWNFPIILSLGKMIPALLTGNTCIVKPSPFTPYTTLKVVELAQDVLPPGVLQVVGGDDQLGPMMTAHPGISKISFTGSVATGKKIMAACAQTLKRVVLELGGNDAAIVLPDVDIKKVAPQLVMGVFQNSGQVCVATKRIYIHKHIYRELLAEMVSATKAMKVGAPSTGAVMGPVQNAMQYEKVREFFADAKSKGYRFAVGGSDASIGEGYFVQPAIIDNPPNDSRIVTEEPFGPIVPTQPWEDEDEVIQRANSSSMGLGACVWSADEVRAERIGRRLEAGSVFINSFEKATPQAFLSGHKESGIGGEWGTEGIKAYCNAQVMHTYKAIAGFDSQPTGWPN